MNRFHTVREIKEQERLAKPGVARCGPAQILALLVRLGEGPGGQFPQCTAATGGQCRRERALLFSACRYKLDMGRSRVAQSGGDRFDQLASRLGKASARLDRED